MLLWDALCWMGAIFLVAILRYDLDLSDRRIKAVLLFGGVSLAAHLILGVWSKVLQSRYRSASFEEAVALAVLTVASTVIGWCTGAIVYGPSVTPPAMVLAVPPIVVVMLITGRGFSRALRAFVRQNDADRERVLVIGAGDAATELARAMRTNKQSPYTIVGFLDDDPAKRYLRLSGRPVMGSVSDLQIAAQQAEVNTAILAIGSPDKDLVRRINQLAHEANIELLTLPPVAIKNSDKRELVDKIRRLEVSDFLGRAPINTDLTAVKGYIEGKRVLITGAGGSIGSEIARQVHSLNPSELYLLDRDESAL